METGNACVPLSAVFRVLSLPYFTIALPQLPDRVHGPQLQKLGMNKNKILNLKILKVFRKITCDFLFKKKKKIATEGSYFNIMKIIYKKTNNKKQKNRNPTLS